MTFSIGFLCRAAPPLLADLQQLQGGDALLSSIKEGTGGETFSWLSYSLDLFMLQTLGNLLHEFLSELYVVGTVAGHESYVSESR